MIFIRRFFLLIFFFRSLSHKSRATAISQSINQSLGWWFQCFNLFPLISSIFNLSTFFFFFLAESSRFHYPLVDYLFLFFEIDSVACLPLENCIWVWHMFPGECHYFHEISLEHMSNWALFFRAFFFFFFFFFFLDYYVTKMFGSVVHCQQRTGHACWPWYFQCRRWPREGRSPHRRTKEPRGFLSSLDISAARSSRHSGIP